MWQDAYRQSENIQLRLKAEILELQKLRNEAADEVAPANSKKRRRDADQPSEDSSARLQKLAKSVLYETGTGTQSGEMVVTTSLWHQPEWAMVLANGLGDSVLQGIYILQQTLTSNMSGPVELVNPLCHIARSVCLYLGKAHWATGPKNTTVSLGSVAPAEPQGRIAFEAHENEDIIGNLEAIGQLFPKLLAGLDRLAYTPGGDDYEDQVVYAFIQILQVLLQGICDIAAARVKEHLAKTLGATGPSARNAENPCLYCKNRNLKCDSHFPKCRHCSKRRRRCYRVTPTSGINARHQILANLPTSKHTLKLCELEITMLRSLDTAHQGHAKIMQGFLCILFDMVGHSLQKIVFASHDGGFQQATQASGSSTEVRDREHDEAIEAHAPYLVFILEQAQSFLSWPNLPLKSDTTTEDVQDVTIQSRRKLQNTLLKSVFGQEASIDFEPSLRPAPEFPAFDSMELNSSSEGIGEWFKHKVWRTVGWDVLRNQIKWG